MRLSITPRRQLWFQMNRCSIYVSTAMLIVVLAGCGNSNMPANTPNPTTNQSTDGNSDARNDSQAAHDNGPITMETETTIESAALKQAMIEISVELMTKQQPNTERDAGADQLGS
jgi:PBP1b-binding outer membrane lipoprotein LpoB